MSRRHYDRCVRKTTRKKQLLSEVAREKFTDPVVELRSANDLTHFVRVRRLSEGGEGKVKIGSERGRMTFLR